MTNDLMANATYSSAKAYAESLSQKLVAKYGNNTDVSQSTVNFRALLDNIAVPDAENVLASGNQEDITDYYNLVNVLNKGQKAELYTTSDVLTRQASDHFGYESGKLAEAEQHFKDWYYQAREENYHGALPAQLSVDGYLKYQSGEIASYQDYLAYANALGSAKQHTADAVAQLRLQLDQAGGHYARRLAETSINSTAGAAPAVAKAEASAEQRIAEKLEQQGVAPSAARQTAGSVVFHGLQYAQQKTDDGELQLTSKLPLDVILRVIDDDLSSAGSDGPSWQAILDATQQRDSSANRTYIAELSAASAPSAILDHQAFSRLKFIFDHF
jgi:hypothetical protein